MDNHKSDLQPFERKAGGLLAIAGQAANQAAGAGVFADYRGRKAANTLRRQAADLDLFGRFLADAGAPAGDLAADPQAWAGVTWGLVAAFVRWQLKAGYAVPSINVHLSTLKVYCNLAAQAGAITPGELALIRSVRGYQHKEQKHIDEQRAADGVDTRKGSKKADPVRLTLDQARALKNQPDTPQGRRDRLALCLLLDLGLRVGELAALTVDCFDLKAETLTFYRPKVDKVQTHELKNGCLAAARAWLTSSDVPAVGSIWRSSRKGGELQEAGWTTRGITKRVAALGDQVGAQGLSAHDLRHFWATAAARGGTSLDRLQDAGGWASLAMPGRYVAAARIANQGVKLGEE